MLATGVTWTDTSWQAVNQRFDLHSQHLQHLRHQPFTFYYCCAGYLQSQDVPMVVVSHDREFLDQLCNKLVETEFGVATSYKGNYTEYVKAKEEKIGQQWAAWEKQQKEIARQVKTQFFDPFWSALFILGNVFLERS